MTAMSATTLDTTPTAPAQRAPVAAPSVSAKTWRR